MRVGIAYARQDRQIWLHLDLPAGSTVREAIERSGILGQFPEIDLKKQKVGIFGKLVKLTDALEEDARIEIYRPIVADPRAARRRDRDDDDDDDDDD